MDGQMAMNDESSTTEKRSIVMKFWLVQNPDNGLL